jgi:hypothetical protein
VNSQASGKRHLRTWLWFFAYVALAVSTLGANPFKHQTVTPFDVLVSQRAWHFVDPSVKVHSYQRSDVLNWLLPQWTEARRQLRDGRFPSWDDKIAGGGSFLTASSTLFTPAFLVFALVPAPWLGFYLAMIFNLAVAGTGMHLFLRRRLGWVAAAAGAATFELCGFNAAWLYWPHVFTLIWVPWLLLAIDKCADAPGMRSAVMVAIATALVCLGGFPFLSVLAMEAAALYALVRWVFQRQTDGKWRFASWYAAATVLGLLLAALPLMGLVFWLQQFDIGYRQGRGSYLDIHAWVQLFPPWAYRVQRVEQTMYVGAAMITLALAAAIAIVARWRRIRPLPLFAMLLLVTSAGLVFGLWPMWLIGWLPGMAYNSWSRAIGLLDIALVILGAIAFDRLWRLGTGHRQHVLRGGLLLLALLQVTEIAAFFRDYNGAVSASYYYPKTPSIEYMRSHVGPFDYVITDKSFLMSGTLGVYGLREWLAHYFRSPALQDALHRMAKHPFNSHVASASRFPASDIRYTSSALATYNVRFIAIDSRSTPPASVADRFALAFNGAGTSVYENLFAPDGPYFLADPVATPGAHSGQSISVADYSPRAFHLRYKGEEPGYVVVPMSINDDWQILVNGKATRYELKDGVMPMVIVTGPSTIDFFYRSRLFRWFPAWLALLACAVLAMGLAGHATSRRRANSRASTENSR